MLNRLPWALALVVLAAYAGIVLQYLLSPNFMDHLEPMVASSTWAFLEGRPIYHEAVSAERYAILYGPVLYLFTAVSMLLFGPSLLTSKLGAGFAVLASFVVLYRALRELRLSHALAVPALAWLALALLSFPMASYWNRGDPWMLLLVAAALWGSQRFSPFWAAITCGLAAGALSGIKLHGAIYALPAIALLFERYRLKGVLLAVVAAWVSFVAPFLFFPSRISSEQMFFWIRMTSQHGVYFNDFVRILLWGVFFSLPAIPLLPVLLKRMRPTTLFWSLLSFSLLLACFTGSLKGAGRHHLIPWLPSLVAAYALLVRDARALRPGLTRRRALLASSLKLAPVFASVSAVILSVSDYRHTGEAVRDLSRYPGREIIAELESIQAAHAGQSIEMGYGLDYRLSWYRPLIVFKQGYSLLDGASLMDLQPRGLAVTPKTLERIRTCSMPLWLFPKGEEPLSLHHLAPPNGPIFDEEIRAEFKRIYKRVADHRFYSVWACRPNT